MSIMSITGGASVTAGGGVTYVTGRDTDNDFTMIGLNGAYQLNGEGGYDQLIVGEPSANFNVSAPDANGGVSVSNAKVDYYLLNFENIVFTDRNIKPSGDQGPLAVSGTPGNDQLIGSSKDEAFNGGDGLDTLSITGNQRTSASLSSQGGNDWSLGGVGIGNDTLHSIERIAFADRMVALDVSAAGNAGQAMQFIGTIAPELLNELSIRGLIISLFDQGQSMLQLCELALQLDLIPHASNGELVNQVFQNVTGVAATKDMSDALVDYVEDHGQAEFLHAVAELSLNVDLVGLQAAGLDYFA